MVPAPQSVSQLEVPCCHQTAHSLRPTPPDAGSGFPFICYPRAFIFVCVSHLFNPVLPIVTPVLFFSPSGMSDSFVTLPCTVAHQAPLSMGFSRQEHWSGLPFPSPGDLPGPGIESTSPALAAGVFPMSHHGSPMFIISFIYLISNLYILFIPIHKTCACARTWDI